jgi:hypothetical protein
MDDETRQLIMNLLDKLEDKQDKAAGGTPPNTKGPRSKHQGAGNMRGLNLPNLQANLMLAPHFFRKLTKIIENTAKEPQLRCPYLLK